MNKQEVIEYINELPVHIDERVSGSNAMINKSAVLQLIEQMDKPQKVVIPKFVAEIIEYHKEIDGLLKDVYAEGEAYRSEFEEWLLEVDNAHDIVARAWLDGYEVEKEKLYTVEIPNPKKSYEHAVTLKRTSGGDIVIYNTGSNDWKDCYRYQLTEAEIKKDFAWAWNAGFAEEVEDETEK